MRERKLKYELRQLSKAEREAILKTVNEEEAAYLTKIAKEAEAGGKANPAVKAAQEAAAAFKAKG